MINVNSETTTNLKEKRDELNSKVKELIDSVRDDTAKLKDLNERIKDLKTNRDKENEAIKDLKEKRDVLNKEIGTLVENLKKLQKDTPKTNQKEATPKNLDAEIKRLEWTLQTKQLTVKKYDELHDTLEKLKEQKEQSSGGKETAGKFRDITKKLDAMRKDARKMHQEVMKKSEKAKEHHEEMIKLFPEVKELRKNINPVAKDIQKMKKDAEEYHNKLIDELGDIKNDDRRAAQKETAKQDAAAAKEMEKEAERLFKEFTSGKKLTSEEFMIIKQYGKNLL